MKQNEMGFSFGDQHSRDFGLIWAESKGHQLAPEIIRNEYTIAGKSGTVLLNGGTRKPLEFSGSLFVVDHEPANQREAQELARRIIAWLGNGRQRLVFDYEPDRFYLAQVDNATTWSLETWFGGEISIKFKAQPYAYSVNPDIATVLTPDEAVTIPLRVDTLHPAPLEVRVTNTGTATIDAVTVMLNLVNMQGLALTPGHSLTISMEEPIGAYFDDGRNALPCAQRFDLVLLPAGVQGVPVTVGYTGEGSHCAQISVAVRGRW